MNRCKKIARKNKAIRDAEKLLALKMKLLKGENGNDRTANIHK